MGSPPGNASAAFRVDRSTGLVAGARQRHSPNQDGRPVGQVPELVVVHGISLPPGHFGGSAVDALFRNCLDPGAHAAFRDLAALRVSAHLFIRRDGCLVQYVPLTRRAWHAGRSCWRGRPRCNDFSIGIELEGTDQLPYEPVQYAVLAALLRALFRAWPALGPERVTGHSDVAPGRKTDPGDAFAWRQLHALLAVPAEAGDAGASGGSAVDGTRHGDHGADCDGARRGDHDGDHEGTGHGNHRGGRDGSVE